MTRGLEKNEFPRPRQGWNGSRGAGPRDHPMQGLRAHGSRHVFSPSPQKSVTGNLPPAPHPLTACSVTDTMDLLTPPE